MGFNKPETSGQEKFLAAKRQTWLTEAVGVAVDRSKRAYDNDRSLDELTVDNLNKYQEDGHSMERVDQLLGEVNGLNELEDRLADDTAMNKDFEAIGFGEGITAEGMGYLVAGEMTDVSTWAASLGIGKAMTSAVKLASTVKNARLASNMAKMNKYKRSQVIAGATVGSTLEGGLDRDLRGQSSKVEDFALDAAIGLSMGALGSRFVLPKEVYDVQTMRSMRDAGLKPDEIDEGLKSELSEYVDDSGQWLTDEGARNLLNSKAEQKAHSLAQRKFGSYTIHSQLANHQSSKVNAVGQYVLRDGLQGEKGVKQEHAISERIVRRRDKVQGIILKSRMKHYRGYLTDQGKYAGRFAGMGLRRQPLADFKKEVSFVLQGGHSDNVHVNAMAKDLHEVYSAYLQRAKEKGFKWADNVVEGNYAPRQWSRAAIQRALTNEGDKERLINTLAKNIEGLESEDATDFSALWVNKMAKGEAGKGDLTDVERFLNDTDSEDYQAFMSELMKNKQGGSGNPQNFKFRIRLKNSSELSDYFESNYETVMMRYVNNMEGHFALAEDGMTMSQFKKMIDEAKADVTGNDLAADNTTAALEYSYNLVAGNALTPSTAFGKDWLRAGQTYTYTRLMGNMGIAQIGDMGTLATEMGYKTLLKNLPAIKQLVKTFKGTEGFATAEALEDLRVSMGNYGESRLMGSGRFDIEYGDEGGGLNYFLDSAKQVTNMANGFNLIDDYLRGAALDSALLKWERVATGKDKGKGLGLTEDRLKELGLEAKDIKRLSQSLYKYADKNDRGRITKLNLDSWSNQRDVDLFLDATTRFLDKAVQRQHHGERIGFILGDTYQPVVQVILQFRSFIFASQNSQFLRNLKHSDRQMFFNWFNGMVTGTMSYMMYLAAQKVARGEDFDDWFNDDDRDMETKLITGAISRTGAFGIIPMMTDTLLDVTGNDPWFNNRSSGLASSLFSWEGSPMVQTLESAGNLGSKVIQGTAQRDLEWEKEDTVRAARLISNHFLYIGLMKGFSEAYE